MVAGRKYRPGSRNPKFRGGPNGDGRMSDNRIAWARTVIGQFIMLEYLPEEREGNEDDLDIEQGPSYRLVIPRPTGRPVIFNMCALTYEELDILRQFFNLLFDKAEPVVKLRDKVAEDAFANGDDSHARIYRQVPQFVVRQRPQREHSEGVHDRPESLPSGDMRGGHTSVDEGDHDGGVRGVGEELAQYHPQDGSTQDDQQTAD